MLRDIIARYLDEVERIGPLGKTKRATLEAIGETWIGTPTDLEITSQALVRYAPSGEWATMAGACSGRRWAMIWPTWGGAVRGQAGVGIRRSTSTRWPAPAGR
ncbi:hypothetical protein GCM10017624_16200 [Azotobacter vinelandii]|nr:hypothetical protein GCM10017624_16200 [Azotobacter vinelandii]